MNKSDLVDAVASSSDSQSFSWKSCRCGLDSIGDALGKGDTVSL